MFAYTYEEIERVTLDLHQLATHGDAGSEQRMHAVRAVFFDMISCNSLLIDKDALDDNVVKLIDYCLAQPPLVASAL